MNNEIVIVSDEQQAEYNKFLGFYSEAHEALDAIATEYNTVVAMRGPFTFTDDMRLDLIELSTIAEDLKAKLHKVFLVNGIEQAAIDQKAWREELEKVNVDAL